ncbi:HNH endonuclease [Amycolatopsis sp. lyj-112]|uniref:HNH endonuclease n=1 Tax=Amycolatopsis sp. lyj-112 TaxID=2789288 RepID=UPI003979FB06
MVNVGKRFCAGGCRRVLATAGRCPECKRAKQQQQDQARGTSTQRGYGYDHVLARAELLADEPVCWICGLPGADTADHLRPRSRGGRSEIDNYLPAHKRCNSSRGSKE